MSRAERKLQCLSGRCLSLPGCFVDGSTDPEKIAAWIERKAREELRIESGYRMSEAIKKHPRA